MINKLAATIQEQGAQLVDAQIKGIQDAQYIIEDSSGVVCKATRAFGCIVEPEKGDTVLIAHFPHSETHILTVLQRTSDNPAKLSVEKDMELEAPNGQMRVFGKDGISLGSLAELKVIAKEFNLSAEQSRLIVNRLLVMGNNVKTKWEKAKVSVDSLDTVIGRAVQVFSSRFTRVKALERLKAKVVHHESEDVYAIRSKFTVVTAKKDVKIDGKQILMG